MNLKKSYRDMNAYIQHIIGILNRSAPKKINSKTEPALPAPAFGAVVIILVSSYWSISLSKIVITDSSIINVGVNFGYSLMVISPLNHLTQSFW